MSEEERISAAIDKAKGFFSRVEGEPLLPTDRVLLREVVHALEILWGYTQHELDFGADAKAPQALNDGLRIGRLIARVHSPKFEAARCHIIPTSSWPKLDPARGDNAFNENFWHGTIQFDHDCDGYSGCLPFVIREEAEAWLAEMAQGFERYSLQDRIRQLFMDGHKALKPDEPPIDVPAKFISLPCLAYALERLRGDGAERTGYGHKPNLHEQLLSALAGCELTAEVWGSQVKIPAEEWLAFKSSESPAFGSSFLFNEGFESHANPNLRGQTPAIRSSDAMEWLIGLVGGQPSEFGERASCDAPHQRSRPIRHGTTEELIAALREWIASFPTDSKPTTRIREQWYRNNGISRERGRALLAEHAPVHWSKRGRPKTGDN